MVLQRRPERALKQLEYLPNFEKDLQKYIYERVQKEASLAVHDKEHSLVDFDRHDIESFSYDAYHSKLLNRNPILMSALTGSISNLKYEQLNNPTRKGFGGSRQSELISLKPALCQTVARLLHNKHPRSVTQIQCLNSVLNAVQHIPGKAVSLGNGFGKWT